MRKSLLDQLPLVPVPIDHSHARELGAVSMLLDQLPEAEQCAQESPNSLPLPVRRPGMHLRRRWPTVNAEPQPSYDPAKVPF